MYISWNILFWDEKNTGSKDMAKYIKVHPISEIFLSIIRIQSIEIIKIYQYIPVRKHKVVHTSGLKICNKSWVDKSDMYFWWEETWLKPSPGHVQTLRTDWQCTTAQSLVCLCEKWMAVNYGLFPHDWFEYLNYH